ncbi:MAG: SurA N-terminal domain-containing protein [bacterium]
MLQGIREGMKPIMWVVIIAFVGAIFLWGASTGIRLLTERRASKLAIVGGHSINRDEFFIEMQREYAMELKEARKQFKGNITEDMDKYLRMMSAGRTFEMMIYRQILLNIAERLGIVVSDEVIRDRVVTTPAFQRDGEFDIKLYEEILSSELYMAPVDFEETMRKELACAFVVDVVVGNTRISPKELREFVNDYLSTASIDYIVFPVNEYIDRVNLTQEDIEKYYNNHKERYWKPESVKIKYIHIDINKIMQGLDIPEEEILSYYEEHKNDYADIGMIHTRQILIAVPEGADPSSDIKAKNKAMDIIRELNSGANFSDLAKKYSEHPSASKGGDLGFYVPGQWGDEFDRAALNLNEREWTKQPVRDKEGYHIIYREPDVPPFEEEREDTKTILKQNKAVEMAKSRANEIYESVKGGNLIDQVGRDFNLEVVESEYFSRDGNIKGLGLMPDIASEAFKINIGDAGRVVPITQSIAYAPPQLTGYVVFQLIDKKPSEVSSLESIRGRVENDAKKSKAYELAIKEASDIFNSFKGGEINLNYIADKTGKRIERSENVSKMIGAPGIGKSIQILDFIFSAELNKVSRPLPSDDGIYFIVVKSVTKPSEEDFNKYLTNIMNSTKENLRRSISMDFYNYYRNRVDVKIDVEELVTSESKEEQAELMRKMKQLMQTM